MNDSFQYTDLSEGERLEFLRRRDEALAVCDEALRQFLMKHALEENVQKAKKLSESKWFWIIGAIGFALDRLVFRDPSTVFDFNFDFDFDFNFGTFIFAMAVGGWVLGQHEVGRLKQKLDEAWESIYRLQMQLAAVAPYRDIWELSKIAVENGDDSKEYEAWRCNACFWMLGCITGDERAKQLREKITLAVELGIRQSGTDDN